MNVTIVAVEVIGQEIVEVAQGEEEVVADLTIGGMTTVMVVVVVVTARGGGVTFVMSMVIWPVTAAIISAEAGAGVVAEAEAGAQNVLVIAEAAAGLPGQAADLIEERTRKRTEADLAHHQQQMAQRESHETVHPRTMNKLICVL